MNCPRCRCPFGPHHMQEEEIQAHEDRILKCACEHPNLIAPGWRVSHSEEECVFSVIKDQP